MALKILVVDDEKPIAEILKFNLERKKDMKLFVHLTVMTRLNLLKRRIQT